MCFYLIALHLFLLHLLPSSIPEATPRHQFRRLGSCDTPHQIPSSTKNPNPIAELPQSIRKPSKSGFTPANPTRSGSFSSSSSSATSGPFFSNPFHSWSNPSLNRIGPDLDIEPEFGYDRNRVGFTALNPSTRRSSETSWNSQVGLLTNLPDTMYSWVGTRSSPGNIGFPKFWCFRSIAGIYGSGEAWNRGKGIRM